MSETRQSRKVPADVRKALVQRLGREAKEMGWESLPMSERTRHYDLWASDPLIRQAVGQYLGTEEATRSYIKDTLTRRFRSDETTPQKVLAILKDEFGPGFEPATGGVGKGLLILRGPAGGALCVNWGSADRWKELLGRLLEGSDALAQRRDGDEPLSALVVIKKPVDTEAQTDTIRRVCERCRVRLIVRSE